MGPLISQLSENLDDRWIWGSSLVILTVFVFVTLYRQALPKFYPDIPHHPDAKGRLLGDLPSLIAHAKQSGGQVTDWMSLQCVELNSPIIQVAIKPFSPPFVIVDDHTTNEDILTKRTAAREFDRGQDSTDFFGHVMPDASIVMKSNERFRSQRHMWAGTMSPSFLNDIAAPHMHAIFSKLVKLWTRKSKLAAGHPFEAADDLKLSTLDVIWAIVHGTELGSVQSQIDFLSSQDPRSQGADLDTAVFLPRAEMPPLANALQYLVNSTTPRNLFPTIRKYYMYCRPDFRAAWKIKEQSVGKLLQTSRDKFLGEKRQGPSSISCAMDYVIGKEGAASEKAGQIVMDDRSMKDETFMMLLGGHETTSTELQWAVKYLADDQDVQSRLHDDLKTAFSRSADVHFSSTKEIVQADIPYLDAVVHEILRCARVTPVILREAMQDTQILGYNIPKGTSVLCSLQQDSFLGDDTLEPVEPSAQGEHRALGKTWQRKDRRKFDPSRWLTSVSGKEIFDPNAGPSLPFSAGTRGCFGKRLAIIELRMAVALLVRNFHFSPLPASLNSYQGYEVITRMPRQSFVRPSVAD